MEQDRLLEVLHQYIGNPSPHVIENIFKIVALEAGTDQLRDEIKRLKFDLKA